VCGHPAFDWGETVEREVRAHDATHYRAQINRHEPILWTTHRYLEMQRR
jgi:hypothetical protein